jgi:ribosome production factor 1
MFSCLFPKRPEFEGRQVVTLHNQRDFIFFRRHRYIFKADAIEYDENEDENQDNEKQDDGDTPKMDEGPTSEFETRGTGVDIQEIGPRFCLKLQWLLNGTDIKNGEYEWMHKPELDLTRTTFHL